MLLRTLMLITAAAFSAVSLLVLIIHEMHMAGPSDGALSKAFLRNQIHSGTPKGRSAQRGMPDAGSVPADGDAEESLEALMEAILSGAALEHAYTDRIRAIQSTAPPALRFDADMRVHEEAPRGGLNEDPAGTTLLVSAAVAAPIPVPTVNMGQLEDDGSLGGEPLEIKFMQHDEHEQVGTLTCNGKDTKSEVIYWKVVPGDNEFESPITPHHGMHHDRYLTFEYDNAGWNNMRMAMECLIVCAHAMGRTVVLPPYQLLHHINTYYKSKNGKDARAVMGFEDFFNVDILRSHRGFHVITMKEFLEKEALTGGLHGEYPPDNSSDAWGQPLWRYMERVADERPAWGGVFIAFPDRPGDFNFSQLQHPRLMERMKRFGGSDRTPVYYEEKLQRAHHLHFPGTSEHRVLQHHYAFTFFANPAMQSFYKRFIRDYMRYRDEIQCLGHELVKAVRADARAAGVATGDYYALHIRRGDFFKAVKIQASDILRELTIKGIPIIPPGSTVYISTDDPFGVCKNCRANGKGCDEYGINDKPEGCPKDPSWTAFTDYGWKIRFLKDYMNRSFLVDSNPNVHGMVESIVCSRARAFAGTWFSTFTGYIHRLRGYHGLGEDTYYHSPGHVTQPQSLQSVGHGFSREWRAGWTDDAGELI